MIKDLDSGEKFSLHEAADRIPQGVTLDPLSRALKQRTPSTFQDAGVGTMDDSDITAQRRSSDYEPKEKKTKKPSLKRERNYVNRFNSIYPRTSRCGQIC